MIKIGNMLFIDIIALTSKVLSNLFHQILTHYYCSTFWPQYLFSTSLLKSCNKYHSSYENKLPSIFVLLTAAKISVKYPCYSSFIVHSFHRQLPSLFQVPIIRTGFLPMQTNTCNKPNYILRSKLLLSILSYSLYIFLKQQPVIYKRSNPNLSFRYSLEEG